MKTVLDLTKLLVGLGILTTPFNARQYPRINKRDVFASGYGMTDETYGKESYVYLHTPTLQDRVAVQGMLRVAGFRVSNDYNTLGPTAEIRVSYFKGFHHNE